MGLGVPAAGNTNRFSTTAFHARRFLASVVSTAKGCKKPVAFLEEVPSASHIEKQN